MDKKLLEQLKEKLEKEKDSLTKELKSFAKKDDVPKGDWETKYPKREENSDMEEEADEFQEYDNMLSVEHSLELKLRDVNIALDKFSAEGGSASGGKYGLCEKCGAEIKEERLKAVPEARLCMKHNK